MKKDYKLPQEVFAANVTPNAKLLYALLKKYEGENEFPSYSKLAEEFSEAANIQKVASLSIRNWIKELEKNAIIEMVESGLGPSKKNHYKFLV